MTEVSIIVPIYNSEKYIRRCIESLLSQTYNNIEIILVNDGSEDSSVKICEEFINNDSRIRFFSQENKGVSAARNLGLAHAKGKFVVFVDSDDYVMPEYIKSLYMGIKEGELSVCTYEVCNNENQRLIAVKEIKSEYTSMEFYEWLFSFEKNYQGYLWNKMFRKDIIDEFELHFDECIQYNEDRLFITQYVKQCDKIIYIDIPLYVYVLNENSAMGKIKKGYRKEMLTELTAFDKIIHILDRESILNTVLLIAYFKGCRMMKIADSDGRLQIRKYCISWLRKFNKLSQITIRNRCKIVYYGLNLFL